MKCDECGKGDYEKLHQEYQWQDKYLGNLSIDQATFMRCDYCEDVLLPPDTTKKMTIVEIETKKRLIDSLFPMNQLMTAKDTASFLEISTAALAKNRRINNGFIYWTVFGKSKAYVKRSVIQFKKTGDGRFPLFMASFSNEQTPIGEEYINLTTIGEKNVYSISIDDLSEFDEHSIHNEDMYAHG